MVAEHAFEHYEGDLTYSQNHYQQEKLMKTATGDRTDTADAQTPFHDGDARRWLTTLSSGGPSNEATSRRHQG